MKPITLRASPPSTPRSRASESFKAASERLHEALPKDVRNQLARIEFPNFENTDTVETKGDKLEKVIESFIEARREFRLNPKRSQIVKNAMRSWFRATYPFAQTFLIIGKAGSAVVALATSLTI
jgi:hypothetical protein